MAICEHCGRDLGDHPRDIGFALPDEVWRLSTEEQARRVQATSDLCVLDDARYFLRAVARVPIADTDGDETFNFGLWAEVSAPVFERYRRLYNVDATHEPLARGKIANDLPHYPPLRGHPVKIRFGGATERPLLELSDSDHPLSFEQRHTISLEHVHQVLEATGSGWSAKESESESESWEFDQARNVAAITSVDVIRSEAPVLLVIHYSDDHSWAFLSGLLSSTEDLQVVLMKNAVARDPTLREVADLPPGWVATRTRVGEAWERYRDPDM